MVKSKWVQQSIEDVFADDGDIKIDLDTIRSAAREAAVFIKKLRASAGLTQRGLAARLGISQPRVSAMERGIGPEGPNYLMLKRVAVACGVPWSLETGLNSEREEVVTDRAEHVRVPQERSSTAHLIEEVLQSSAPRALHPKEIRRVIRRDKGVGVAFTSIRKTLDQLEARHIAEQLPEEKTWRYGAERRSAPYRAIYDFEYIRSRINGLGGAPPGLQAQEILSELDPEASERWLNWCFDACWRE